MKKKAILLALVGLLAVDLVVGLGWCVVEAYILDQYTSTQQDTPSEWGAISLEWSMVPLAWEVGPYARTAGAYLRKESE